MKIKTSLRSLLLPAVIVFFNNCQKLDTLTYLPTLRPDQFLAGHHWIHISFGSGSFILNQPSSTFFVYFLSGIYLFAAYVFWKVSSDQKSRWFWSFGFLFTGIAAILAGTSYQALGYELKCQSREFCRWTTWLEIHYEILQNVGMNGFLAAAAFTHAKKKGRTILLSYAVLNSVLYATLVLYGAITANRFLVSFEFLELSCLPSVLFFLISTITGYKQKHNLMNFHLQNTWLFLVIIIFAYAVYLEFGFTNLLWAKGIWFSENDVLHVGLILWVFYILKFLPKEVKDSD